MAQEQNQLTGPDLTQGVSSADFADCKLLGHVGDEAVLLIRSGAEVFAVGAHCTHYHGPLADGIVVGESVRCPWHHACFDLRSGEALRAPALSPITCWKVEQRDGRIFVTKKIEQEEPRAKPATLDAPRRIIIVGGGAAGFAAAEMLRRHEFQGSIVMLSGDNAPPVDRPNLSKDYLAGSAPEDWLPLRPADFYARSGIELRLNSEVVGVDTKERRVRITGGESLSYDRLLLATGAEPVRLTVPGADRAHVYTLRTLADCQAIIGAAESARRAVVVGASFIGLEVAASLRARNIEVHVVAPEAGPMERVLGRQFGDFIRALHEEHGVVFHLGETVTAIEDATARLRGGAELAADLVVVGIGVRPRSALAAQAGIKIDGGVTVDAFLQTSAPGVYAAGDIARWPDPHSGAAIRVEHWVVAERQGQVAARNMLGSGERFDAVPFFWSQHYDVQVNYVGHVEQWDEIVIEGAVDARDCLVRYKRNGRVLAVASIFRDVESLNAELAMERGVAP
jgi:NADPH-dependent 2,4-dienoyl-CoA reductase/sulfur reductase-like enzyme/nitrite reductase/ring-hydroxylating ferredoxin subunit